jgi:hypothetical protein
VKAKRSALSAVPEIQISDGGIMKNIIVRIMITAAGCLTLGISVHAQNTGQYRANVPFNFSVGNKTYSAGKYTVGPVSTVSSTGAILLTEKRTGYARIIGVGDQGFSPAESAKLIFRRMGTRYALVQVTTTSFGLKLKEAKRDATAAMTGRAGGVVEIALN